MSTCGKFERFHQTLKRFLARHHRASTIAELQGELDRFRAYYNTVRPHRAIGRRTPAEAFEARPKAAPSLPGLPVPRHVRVRRDRIDMSSITRNTHHKVPPAGIEPATPGLGT
jgi:hypothetical protein